MQRIEAALARIAVAADGYRPAPPSVTGMVGAHRRLRQTTAEALRELDGLIDELER
ncbi:hypothetical protein [Pelagerythrobacter sp.]|uniref:hypothetical protein n=1 Tax=Pelagerythrobacter sp. TaxID=2800702 RepID=UPI0035AF60B0